MASDENLLSNPAESPGSTVQSGSGTESGPEVVPEIGPAAPATPSENLSIDELLMVEDPTFAASMSELRDQVAKDIEHGSVAPDAADSEVKPMSKWMSFKTSIAQKIAIIGDQLKRFVASLKDFRSTAITGGRGLAKLLLKLLKASAAFASRSLKLIAVTFKALPRASKFLVFATAVLGVASLLVLRMVLHGHYLPTLETRYLRSFADVADQKFTYDPDAPMEDFTDPIHHPEHVVLVDKVVVNLRRRNEASNPMGLFEFYVDVSSDEGAVEIKDRDPEVRDLMARTIEQMTYDELHDADGKNKLKLILRKNLNGFITRGRVRRVYFRNVVLKE